jgi:hypothetical protein
MLYRKAIKPQRNGDKKMNEYTIKYEYTDTNKKYIYTSWSFSKKEAVAELKYSVKEEHASLIRINSIGVNL